MKGSRRRCYTGFTNLAGYKSVANTRLLEDKRLQRQKATCFLKAGMGKTEPIASQNQVTTLFWQQYAAHGSKDCAAKSKLAVGLLEEAAGLRAELEANGFAI